MNRPTLKTPCRGLFVAGTDTGVGKTVVAAALLHGLASRNLRAAGMKPVAAGSVRRRGVWINEDVEALRAAATVDVPREWMNPYCFAPPIAPHIAAAEARIAVRMDRIRQAYARIAARSDVVVVEGVGGVLVPLGPRLSAVDLPDRLQLPVVLVVGLRLGCINHALLSVEALVGRGLRLAGWVGNRIDPEMSRAAQNVDAIRRRMPAPLLGVIPTVPDGDPARVSGALDFDTLLRAF